MITNSIFKDIIVATDYLIINYATPVILVILTNNSFLETSGILKSTSS